MEIFNNLKEVTKDKNTVLTLGTFDGVHLGHKKIIDRMKEKAAKIGGRNFLITFHPHPRIVVSKGKNEIRLLNTQREKISLLESYGVQNLLIIEFTKEFSQLSSEEFVKQYIINGIGLNEIVIGYDHHFGKGRGGDVNTLREMGEQFGFKVSSVDAVTLNDSSVSSTKIRNALAEGDIARANLFLGRPYCFSGTVIEGDKRGRLLGFPTANLRLEDESKLLPAIGIYAVEFILKGEKLLGVMSLGKRPTFYDSGNLTAEVYIYDFDKEIYGEFVTVNIIDRIRGEEKYDSAEELIEQMKKDKEAGINILNKLT